MKEKIISEIIKEMLPTLSNEQLRKLKDTLEICLHKVYMEKTNDCEITEEIDYLEIFLAAKRIEGCSEKTLTYYETFYGPSLAASFGELAPFSDMTFKEFENIICKDAAIPYEYEMPAVWTDEFINWTTQDRSKEERKNEWLCINPGVCRGRLIGGNLHTMWGFFGTEYMPEIKDGDILLIEDTCKDAFTMEKLFSMLKLAGVFEKVSGIVLGKHERFQDGGTGRRPYEILLEVLGETKVPLLAEFDCCHTLPMFMMPIGCQVELNAMEKSVVLLEEPLE